MQQKYDVVVIGAGPAGSTAARVAAEAGLSTLLLEKRQEIGSPVRCAEAVGRDTVENFIPLDPRWICADIETFSVTNARGDCVVLPPMEKTLVLERKIFDRELAHAAARAGAEVQVKARAIDLCPGPDKEKLITLNVKGERIDVQAKIVIGADGTEGQSARWAGLKTLPSLRDYYVAAQYLLTGVAINQHICQYHIGWGIAPNGYAWVFPKGDDMANVGLVVTPKGSDAEPAIRYLNDFVQNHFPGCSVLSQVVGGIPVTNVLSHMVADGYLAVGDAAHQSDPLTAGGITNGMYGGLLAAQVAAESIRAHDTSARFLSRYEQRWDAQFGALFRRLYRIRQAVIRIPDDKLSEMIAQAAQMDSRHMSLVNILSIVIKTQPSLLLEALPILISQKPLQ